MPKPIGPQFEHVLSLIDKAAGEAGPDWRSGIIEGDQAKAVFKAANIRQWPLVEHATSQREGWTEYSGTVYPHETLHTTQTYLHAPTLKKYMEEGAPEFDPEYEGEEREYRPEVLETERGTKWIDEGHHRLVASRLNRDYSTKVWGGPLLKTRYQ